MDTKHFLWEIKATKFNFEKKLTVVKYFEKKLTNFCRLKSFY